MDARAPPAGDVEPPRAERGPRAARGPPSGPGRPDQGGHGQREADAPQHLPRVCPQAGSPRGFRNQEQRHGRTPSLWPASSSRASGPSCSRGPRPQSSWSPTQRLWHWQLESGPRRCRSSRRRWCSHPMSTGQSGAPWPGTSSFHPPPPLSITCTFIANGSEETMQLHF